MHRDIEKTHSLNDNYTETICYPGVSAFGSFVVFAEPDNAALLVLFEMHIRGSVQLWHHSGDVAFSFD